MTTNYHTPIPTSPAQEARAALWNSRYSQLDTALDDANTNIAAHQSELVTARSGYASLDARLSAMTVAGGNVATLVAGAASSGQKVVDVDSTTGFVAGAYVAYALDGGNVEYNQIAVVTSSTRLTLENNIGTGGIDDNTYLAMISPSEYQAANSIHHGADELTLRAAMLHVSLSVYSVDAYGAVGDGVTNDTAAIQAALDAADADGGGTVVFSAGKTYVVDCLAGGCDIYSHTRLRGNGARMYLDMDGGDSDPGYRFFNIPDGETDIEISGFEFYGSNSSGSFTSGGNREQACIFMAGTGATTSDVWIHHCLFHELWGFTVHLAGAGERVHVTDCTMRHCANGLNVNADYSLQARNVLWYAEGIECSGSYAIIADNIILFPFSGISLGGTTGEGDTVVGQVVRGNIIADTMSTTLGSGISVNDGCESVVIANNTIIRTYGIGIQISPGAYNPVSDVLIANNILRSCGYDDVLNYSRIGIYVATANASKVKITGNHVYNADDDADHATLFGIYVNSADQIDIDGNAITAALKDIALDAATSVSIGANRMDWTRFEAINGTTFVDTGPVVAKPNGSDIYRLGVDNSGNITATLVS